MRVCVVGAGGGRAAEQQSRGKGKGTRTSIGALKVRFPLRTCHSNSRDPTNSITYAPIVKCAILLNATRKIIGISRRITPLKPLFKRVGQRWLAGWLAGWGLRSHSPKPPPNGRVRAFQNGDSCSPEVLAMTSGECQSTIARADETLATGRRREHSGSGPWESSQTAWRARGQAQRSKPMSPKFEPICSPIRPIHPSIHPSVSCHMPCRQHPRSIHSTPASQHPSQQPASQHHLSIHPFTSPLFQQKMSSISMTR